VVQTASSGRWVGAQPMTFAYQWQRCDAAGSNCTDVAGADKSTYTLTHGDIGFRSRVKVNATNPDGTATAFSDVRSVQRSAAPANERKPSISGTAAVGSTLTASRGSWIGAQPIAFAYQWARCAATCTNIPGATAASYTAVAEDRGATLRVVVSATNPDEAGPPAAFFSGTVS
jgi:hypothetical protein